MKVEGGLIVHLARATARRPGVDRLLADCPVPMQVLDAVDGRSAPPAVLAAYDPACAHAPRYPFPLMPGEIACFLSHRAAWARIVSEGWQAGLVIEDDAAVSTDPLARALRLAGAHPGDGAIQLQTRGPVAGQVIARDGDVTLCQPDLAPLRTTSSVYSREASQRLLEVTARFDRPIDVFLQMQWVTGVCLRVIYPSGVTEASGDLGGTTIQKPGRGLFDRLNREVRRPLFRAAMARRARR